MEGNTRQHYSAIDSSSDNSDYEEEDKEDRVEEAIREDSENGIQSDHMEVDQQPESLSDQEVDQLRSESSSVRETISDEEAEQKEAGQQNRESHDTEQQDEVQQDIEQQDEEQQDEVQQDIEQHDTEQHDTEQHDAERHEKDEDQQDTEQQDEEATPKITLENATTRNVDKLIKPVVSICTMDISKKRSAKRAKKLLSICPLVQKFGLDQVEFNALFELIMSGLHNFSSCKSLIELLLPRDDIADDYVIRIIGSVSRKEAPLDIINLMLKWTVTVFDVINTKRRLSNLYHVFFRHLKYEELRHALCHVLYYLTKKEHVTTYRVTRLKEMIDSEKDNASLIALLMSYQTFDPTIVVPHNARLADMLVFTNPLPAVRENLIQLRLLWKHDLEPKLGSFKDEIRIPSAKRVRLTKRQNGPRIRVDPSTESRLIDVSQVINNMETVSLPEQLTMVLENRSLQYSLLYEASGTAVTRLSYYIVQMLYDLIASGNKKDPQKTEMIKILQVLLKFTRFTKTQLPAVEVFLFRYLKTWNGYEFVDEILELITYLKPTSFRELYQYVLKPLSRLYITSDVKWKARLILCYSDWLRNWAALDWKQHVHNRNEATTDVDRLTTFFGHLSFNVDYFQTIQRFVEHVDKLCIAGLLAEEDHVLLQHAGLTFFELVASISRQDDIPDIIIPAATFVHRNFFSTTAMAVSRMCGIIHQYKVAFEENDHKSVNWSSKHTQEYLDHFNTYMMDICNSLWRNLGLCKSKEQAQAFSFTEKNIEQFLELCQDKQVDPKLVLSITHSGALLSLSKRFMEIIEEDEKVNVHHDKPITANYLKELEQEGGVSIGYMEYRVELLDHLTEIGLKGIPDLLYACMNSLIQLKKSAVS
ncbi:Centromere protein I [Choanephora cucurbitarum]|uniref:Centromere protein I n=1 Tax=Choanephora cucurbitarum TaxID=101091 RepID=A0A1C7N9E8_9FUNG|nr:Centromere protein I [Choanephora cucurbitarum]